MDLEFFLDQEARTLDHEIVDGAQHDGTGDVYTWVSADRQRRYRVSWSVERIYDGDYDPGEPEE